MPRVRETTVHDDIAEKRRSAILASAEQLLAIHGFDALRLRDVAHEAGVSIGMIQHYFITRDNLLRETVRAASARRVAEWEALGSHDDHAARQLSALLDGAVQDRHRCIVWVETCAAATRHPELQSDVIHTQEAWRTALRRVIESGIERGQLNPQGQVSAIVAILVNLIDGLMLEVATSDSDEWSQTDKTRLLLDAGKQLLGIVTP